MEPDTVSEDGRSSTFRYGGRISFTLAELLDRALKLMDNDPKRAAGLFMAWCQQDSEIAQVLPDLVTPYLEDRINERAAATAAAASKEQSS